MIGIIVNKWVNICCVYNGIFKWIKFFIIICFDSVFVIVEFWFEVSKVIVKRIFNIGLVILLIIFGFFRVLNKLINLFNLLLVL